MRTIFLATFFLSCSSYAGETINCYFDKFHQIHHMNSEINGYSAVDQSMEIVDGTTSKETQKLDGKNRATNSVKWVLLKPSGIETYAITYAGDFGELLTIIHASGEGLKSPNGWYQASLTTSQVVTTHTRLGKCLVNQNK